MRISDELLNKLGDYFHHFEINEKYGITFEKFLDMYANDSWHDIMFNDSMIAQRKAPS